jgi:hypothetical protein
MQVAPKRTETAIAERKRPILRPEFAGSMLVAEQGKVKRSCLKEI